MSSTIILPSFATSPYGSDRRSGDRLATNTQAILRFEERLHTVTGTVCDLSLGGAGFLCHQMIAPRTRCTLQFTLPAQKNTPAHTINTPVVVVHSMQAVGQPNQFRANLQFSHLQPAERQHIVLFIKQSL